MAAAATVLVGNLAPPMDAIMPKNTFPPSERGRMRCFPILDATLTLSRRELPTIASLSPFLFLTAFVTTGKGETRNPKVGFPSRREWRSRTGAVGSDFDGNGLDEDDGEDEKREWDVEMQRRLREMEEMKELEKRAEELQNNMEEEEAGEGEEESEEEKKKRVRRELEKLAKEQAQRRETAKLMFELGQKAYGKGMYGRAIEFLEGALTIIPRSTFSGGEIQIWLAMAYEANNRHTDCIELYKQLEKQHPIVSIRRQAAELRYILQAPKLKITKDEMVTIPLIGSSYDRYAATWSDKRKDQDWITKSTTTQSSSSQGPWGDFVEWRPPAGWEKNRVFWLAVTFWLGLVGVALLLQS